MSVSNCVTYEPQQTVTITLSSAAAPQKHTVYLQTHELQLASSCKSSAVRVIVMWALYRSRFRTSFVFENKCIFKGTPDSCNTTLLPCKFITILFQINEVVQMSCAPLAAQGQCEYRLRIWRFFVSVALVVFTVAKLMSCIFSVLNT